ncbi:hypothetical protein [Brachybacterium paraconglomeratum]|uniref:hypothetical protein n=1 Tax=Brachybacterium paraconglomeratum TaxID=173362 RepID=UPI0022E466E8|nr:hypothetical protein [Brachybacterium paraconglomeratum]
MQYTRQQMLAQLGHLVFSEAPAAPEGGGEVPDPQEGQESSQETDEQEGGDDESQEDESEPFDSDRALRKIQKLNSENKNLRTRAHEAEEKASGSEELTKTNEQQASEILRLRVALKHGLPEALVGRLNGSSEEELLADAEELMGLFVAKEPPSRTPKRKTAARTPDSAEDGVDIDQIVRENLTR